MGWASSTRMEPASRVFWLVALRSMILWRLRLHPTPSNAMLRARKSKCLEGRRSWYALIVLGFCVNCIPELSSSRGANWSGALVILLNLLTRITCWLYHTRRSESCDAGFLTDSLVENARVTFVLIRTCRRTIRTKSSKEILFAGAA